MCVCLEKTKENKYFRIISQILYSKVKVFPLRPTFESFDSKYRISYPISSFINESRREITELSFFTHTDLMYDRKVFSSAGDYDR